MVMHCTAEDAENQKQKHSDGSQKTGRNRTAKDYKADDCQHCKREKHSAAQTIAKKPKQQRIEAKADRADTERIILDVYRPGAGSVLSDLVDIEIFCAQKEKCKNRQHGNGAEGCEFCKFLFHKGESSIRIVHECRLTAL